MIPLPLIVLVLLPFTLALPQPDTGAIHVPIVRRSQPNRVANLPKIVEALRNKYGYKTSVDSNSKKRGNSAAIPITDEENDSSYSGVVSIGSPAQNFNLVLDTGSSDLWVATSPCSTCASDIPTFASAKSSTYKAATGPSATVSIAYGSGDVQGTASTDSVAFGGFTITGQEFLAVTKTTSGLISSGLSGIMGLGYEAISSLQTTPFWQALYNANELSEPLFSFYLERYVDDTSIVNAAPGGVLTLGGTNSSLYQGSIEYLDLTGPQSYWLLNVNSLTVQGNSISVAAVSALAAIDTGTTLIGGPTAIVASIWAQVPGSVELTGQYQGLYAFPCSTTVTVTISFGGTSWEISPLDMNLGTISVPSASQMCAGGIFDIGSTVGAGVGVPAWIVGDTFLKNVYSVFRANPASVGFAQLASGLSSSSGTSGSNPLQITVTGSSPSSTSSGSGSGSSGGVFGAASTNKNVAVSLALLTVVATCFTVLL